MALPAPDWISFEADKTEGLDLLGLRAPVQRIGNDLFNGVTTVTPKVRYLSVCGFRRLRPGKPIERGHAFRSKAATFSDEGDRAPLPA